MYERLCTLLMRVLRPQAKHFSEEGVQNMRKILPIHAISLQIYHTKDQQIIIKMKPRTKLKCCSTSLA